jgi:hypothetical protein
MSCARRLPIENDKDNEDLAVSKASRLPGTDLGGFELIRFAV